MLRVDNNIYKWSISNFVYICVSKLIYHLYYYIFRTTPSINVFEYCELYKISIKRTQQLILKIFNNLRLNLYA